MSTAQNNVPVVQSRQVPPGASAGAGVEVNSATVAPTGRATSLHDSDQISERERILERALRDDAQLELQPPAGGWLSSRPLTPATPGAAPKGKKRKKGPAKTGSGYRLQELIEAATTLKRPDYSGIAAALTIIEALALGDAALLDVFAEAKRRVRQLWQVESERQLARLTAGGQTR